MLARLAAGVPIEEPVVVVVAHPDDETLGLGGRLAQLRRLRLIHVTDGAPRDLEDARRAGFAGWRAYARARALELQRALRALGAKPESSVAYRCADQQAAARLTDLARRLAADVCQASAVLTHPYEHGHPDHDAAAFAVHAACAILRRERGTSPLVIEFPSYHLRQGRLATGVFWPDPLRPEHAAWLSPRQRSRKALAVECFATQRNVIAAFAPEERYRLAPAYDFRRAAPPGAALYDAWGWRLTSTIWRREARRALRVLRIPGRTACSPC